MTLMADTHGAIAYVAGRPPGPVVMVHHNYAGSKQFDVDQAAFLARCGYVGVAIVSPLLNTTTCTRGWGSAREK